MKALVLGGGSLKGAWQVGVVQAILENGFEPDMIYGISVGSLNSSFLVQEAGKQYIENGKIDWPSVSKKLIEFWITHITQPESIALVRSRFTLGFDTIMSRFDGLLDSTPLQTLIKSQFDPFVLRNSPIKTKAGAVDILSGEMIYASPQDPNYLDYIIASSSLPTLMPAIRIGGDHRRAFLDGGLREVAPLRQALEDGATEIMCVACHTERMHDEPFNYRSVLKLIERMKDINVNQIVNTDILSAERYIENENFRGKNLRMKLIRPQKPLRLDMLKFNSDDIAALIVQGFREGFEWVEQQK